MKKYYYIKEPVYGSSVNVLVGYDDKALNAYFKKKDIDYRIKENKDIDGRFIWHTNDEGAIHNIIQLKSFDWTIPAQSVAVHELLHFIFTELRSRSMTLGEDSEEAYVYLFCYYFTELWKRLKPKK